MTTAEVQNYPYRGVPLTASIVQALIRQLFGGKLVERQQIVDEVVRTHLSGDGLKASGKNLNAVFGHALTRMKGIGEAESTTVGYWRFPETVASGVDGPLTDDEQMAETDDSFDEPATEAKPVADLEIGEGKSAVYVYYLPMYRLRAHDHGEECWPCKIGRTDHDPLARVLAQAATALPEKPHIAIIFRTDLPGAWETALHCVLKIRGRQIDNSPGSEWFLTSPQEVVELMKTLDPTLSVEVRGVDA